LSLFGEMFGKVGAVAAHRLKALALFDSIDVDIDASAPPAAGRCACATPSWTSHGLRLGRAGVLAGG